MHITPLLYYIQLMKHKALKYDREESRNTQPCNKSMAYQWKSLKSFVNQNRISNNISVRERTKCIREQLQIVMPY